MRQNQWLFVGIVLIIAALFRAWIIDVDGASFESDEAIVGLMARHINAGDPLPTFFYGQAYMGSLDAILVAGGFQILGESVQAIRIVQAELYLFALLTGYALALTVTRSPRAAGIALLLLAIPTSLGALYTTISLGGYNELVIAGNLILLLSWQVTVDRRADLWRWLLLGFVAGVGWWINGAIVSAGIAAGLLGLRYFSLQNWRGYGAIVVGFLIGSAPWWAYNFTHDWEALSFLTSGFEGDGGATISVGEKILALLVLSLPALYGLRYPWTANFPLTLAIMAGGIVYLILITDWIMQARRDTSLDPQPRSRILAGRWVLLVMGVFAAVFVLSSFADATGRYLMPVWVPAAIGLALGLDRLRRAAWWIPAVLLGSLLIMQASTVMHAARSPDQLTPQLVERLRIPPEDDDRLLDWLAENRYTRGYASYWTTFRIVFRSGEIVILDSSLPYDDKGYREAHNRYPPYVDTVAAADRVVWITQNYPELDAEIERLFADAGITYQIEQISVYRVYHDLSQRVSPLELGISEIDLSEDEGA